MHKMLRIRSCRKINKKELVYMHENFKQYATYLERYSENIEQYFDDYAFEYAFATNEFHKVKSAQTNLLQLYNEYRKQNYKNIDKIDQLLQENSSLTMCGKYHQMITEDKSVYLENAIKIQEHCKLVDKSWHNYTQETSRSSSKRKQIRLRKASSTQVSSLENECMGYVEKIKSLANQVVDSVNTFYYTYGLQSWLSAQTLENEKKKLLEIQQAILQDRKLWVRVLKSQKRSTSAAGRDFSSTENSRPRNPQIYVSLSLLTSRKYQQSDSRCLRPGAQNSRTSSAMQNCHSAEDNISQMKSADFELFGRLLQSMGPTTYSLSPCVIKGNSRNIEVRRQNLLSRFIKYVKKNYLSFS